MATAATGSRYLFDTGRRKPTVCDSVSHTAVGP